MNKNSFSSSGLQHIRIRIPFLDMSGNPATLKKWAFVTVPTLVLVGGVSPSFFHSGAQTLVNILPNATLRVLAGQDHGSADEVLAPMLVEFFEG